VSDNYWVYGIHAVESLLRRWPGRVEQLFFQQGRQDERMEVLISLAKEEGVAFQAVPRQELDEKVKGQHQGVVAAAKGGQTLREKDLEMLVDSLDRPPFLLILDGVTDPHNLGACMRSADAAGVDGLIVPKDKSVGLNATVRKVACGAAEVLPFFQVTNLARTLRMLKDKGVWIVGAAGEAEQLVYDCDMKGSMALVMGAEGKGLRRLTREHCDYLVKLPMSGSVESLNVSVATGICLFEAVRQRS
jgi:23S rRNA (guanosine2251-2'-O)-methyltransferase